MGARTVIPSGMSRDPAEVYLKVSLRHHRAVDRGFSPKVNMQDNVVLTATVRQGLCTRDDAPLKGLI